MGRHRLVALGRIGKPQGIRGEVRLHPGGELARGLQGYTRFYVGESEAEPDEATPIQVESQRVQGRFVVVKFAGLDTPDQARGLLHRVLYVERDEMPPVEEDEYYHADLLGCRIVDEAGEEFGRVTDVFNTAAHDVLVIASGGREWMVPLVSEHVTEVDVEAGVIRVREIGALRP